MGVCLRVLKKSNKSRLNSYRVRNSVSIISHVTMLPFGIVACTFVSDNLSRNSCMPCTYVGCWCSSLRKIEMQSLVLGLILIL